MEGRSSVETWAEFGFLGKSGSPKVKCGFGTNMFISTGSNEVYVYSTDEKKLKAILQFPGSVTDLVESCDAQLFVACRRGVYGFNLQLLSHRHQSSSVAASSSPDEIDISSEFLVAGADGVSSLLLVGSVLLTLSQSGASWLLTLYKRPEQTLPSSYEVIGSFCLPLVSPVIQGDAGQTTKSVLNCIHYDDGTPSSSSLGGTDTRSSRVCLEPVLFKLLFGVEAALAKSPVILCGLPDGRLCFLPLRLPGSQLRVLHSLEQPVVLVGASVVMETDPRHARCLVVVGEQGRVVLIRTDKADPERGGSVAGFTEVCVSGPVECGCVDQSCLYYSTGSDLLMLDLSERSAGREDNERSEEGARQNPTSLNVCRVIALNEPTRCAAGEVQLLGLSARGQLQSIRLPLRGQEVGPSKPLSSQVSRSVRDLLSAIGDVCERASVLKTVIKSKNLSLRQLNQVVNISFLLTARGKTREPPTEEKSIRCHSTVSWSRSLQKDCLNLTCVLENSSGYVLERGWTLSISVHPLSGPGEETSSVNFSFPFHSLCPGETLEVSLPVAAAGDTSFPLTLNCSLIFSLSSFLAEVDLASFPDLQDSCFSLPLNTLTVDWLHALQVVRPKETVTLQSSTMDALQAFLSSHQLRCSRGGGASNPEEYSVCVRVSSEFLRNTLMLKNSIQQPESASPNICSSLLGWLLFGDHEGVKSGHQGEGMDSNSLVLHARAPSVSTVKITAKEVSAEEANTGRGESCQVIVEIQIESSSITAVCGLHHAVLHRMQTLLKKTPDEAAPSTQVQTSGLRRALQRAEVLHTQISEALSVGLSSGQTNPFLLRVYQELRENPLLII
ncbi:Fanconi anemia core complex-associated protein 100 isoform X1 [Nothobranchius furzeri]|uniref:Fanconi anemia core complex-associated protein 100 isoform X1 n=1 Tax=Nothobranchius furzeri TaxID=105023 RepID=UPI00240438EC|nr:Fanconi anemia core complex-associated protein 100 isoform X1 [Nothobranchius furzeri]